MIHVLYLDDEEHNLTAFRAAFRRDFQVHVTTLASEAVRMLQEHDAAAAAAGATVEAVVRPERLVEYPVVRLCGKAQR